MESDYKIFDWRVIRGIIQTVFKHARYVDGSHSLRGLGGGGVRLLASHQGELGSIPCGVAPGFSHMGIVPDDAADWWVFSGISRVPRLCIPALLHSHLTSPSSALKTTKLGAVQSDVLQRLVTSSVQSTCDNRRGVSFASWGPPTASARAGESGCLLVREDDFEVIEWWYEICRVAAGMYPRSYRSSTALEAGARTASPARRCITSLRVELALHNKRPQHFVRRAEFTSDFQSVHRPFAECGRTPLIIALLIIQHLLVDCSYRRMKFCHRIDCGNRRIKFCHRISCSHRRMKFCHRISCSNRRMKFCHRISCSNRRMKFCHRIDCSNRRMKFCHRIDCGNRRMKFCHRISCSNRRMKFCHRIDCGNRRMKFCHRIDCGNRRMKCCHRIDCSNRRMKFCHRICNAVRYIPGTAAIKRFHFSTQCWCYPSSLLYTFDSRNGAAVEVVGRALASHHDDQSSFPGRFIPGFLRVGNRAGRCRLLAGFLGVLQFPPPLHSSVAPP
ncbi:hypothetical protein PR048_007829 [Dryococelus australis]|uniref:Uncharacterized protein n=1 Tax=Dryococelus australis TaxID=614101 RepID=A0ABQ9HVC9_9NEOP|nr:hypothetical protein PR048_007829 [Dryococelus australis]